MRTSVSVDAGDARVSDADTDWGVALGGGAGLPAQRALVRCAPSSTFACCDGEGAWDADPRFAMGAVFRLGR